jgi:alpha-glucosidase (family GH31 glycosyl hydrolase)
MACWTGYTWDGKNFPNPHGFLNWCSERRIKNTLNLHPAAGVQPHEARYPTFAASMGQDPADKLYVPFNLLNKTFAVNYHKHMLAPIEQEGIDFWWLDWQQGEVLPS